LAINTLYRYFMDIIEIQTLIDITNTNVYRYNQGSQLSFDQNKNFITLIRCAEIRSIILYNAAPEYTDVDIRNAGFGSNYKGVHRVWTFKFSPDRHDVYFNDISNIGYLIDDIDSVPVIKNLTETINIDKAIFDCRDNKSRNTVFKTIKDGN